MRKLIFLVAFLFTVFVYVLILFKFNPNLPLGSTDNANRQSDVLGDSFNNTFNNDFSDNFEYSDEISGNLNQIEFSPVPQLMGTVRIPVLHYQRISAASFEKHMQFLKSQGYQTLSIREFYAVLMSGKNPVNKSVLITFDGGSGDDFSKAFPILKKYQYIATFFISGQKSELSNAQIQEFIKAGMGIESSITSQQIFAEQLQKQKLTLEEIAGKSVTALVYSDCEFDSQVQKIVKANGYIVGFNCAFGIDHRQSKVFNLNRAKIADDLLGLKKALSGIKP